MPLPIRLLLLDSVFFADWHLTFQNFLSNLNFNWFFLSAMVDIMVMAGGKVPAASSAFSKRPDRNYYSSLCITSITGTFEAFLRR
jgi:hypothetical protein